MADDNSVGGLYLRLGLNLSELKTGFVTASQTVAANISRLNREAELVRLRAEVEIAGLDETADAERILQIRQEALSRQMTIQRDRVRLLEAEYRNLAQTQGENSVTSQRAAVRLERERLALANLERELRNSNDTQGETNNLFGELSELLPSMPTKLQAVGLAFGAITTGAGTAYTAVNNLLENFRELQKQAYELNMPLPDTREFLMKLELGGGDIGDFEGYIRGITDAYVKGEYDDPEFIALRKYGAEITDATGRLKDFKDITEEVYQAWKQAEEAGEGIEFLQLTGGESGIRDAIQLFKRYEEAKADAAKIFKADFDDKQLHELDRAMNLVSAQSQELKNALGDIFVPTAQAAAEKFFNVVHDGTEYLVENKDAIQKWGFVALEVFGELAGKIPDLFPSGQLQTVIESLDKILPDLPSNYAEQLNPESPASKLFDDIFKDNPVSQMLERAEQAQKKFNGELEETRTVTDKIAEGMKSLSEPADVLSQYGYQRIKQFKDELEDLQIELDFGDNEYAKSIAQLKLWEDRELHDKNFVSDAETKAIKKLAEAKQALIDQERDDKIAEIRKSVESEYKTSLENRIDKINEEKEAWVSAGMEEAEAAELAQKRIAKAYEESNAKIQEHQQNVTAIEYEMTHTAFEKEIRDIELWEEAQRQKAETAEEVAGIIAESAAKEAQAFEREIDRIKGKIQSLEDKIFEQEHSNYENDLRKLEQERLRYYEEGIYPSELIERYYQNARSELMRRAEESRSKDGEYTKPPEGQSGWHIIEFGKAVQQEIGLMTDESRIRAQLMTQLDNEARAAVTRMQAAKNVQAVKGREQQGGIEIIEGDRVLNVSQPFEAQEKPPTELEETARSVTEAQRNLAETLTKAGQSFPTEYFQELGMTTRELIGAQKEWAESFVPIKYQREETPRLQTVPPIDNFWSEQNAQQEAVKAQDLMLTSTQRVIDRQNELADSTQEIVEAQNRLSEPKEIPKTNDGIKLGFDYDTAKDIFLTGAGLAAATGATGAGLTFSPAILAGAVVAALGGGLVKGSYDETTAQPEKVTTADLDLSELLTPLNSIDGNVQSVLQEMQIPSQEETVTFETIVTPLNNIAGLVQNILSAMGNAQPPQINVSPSISNNLGGAYVFDNALKSQLVEDITSRIVSEITNAVQQATSRSSYSYSA